MGTTMGKHKYTLFQEVEVNSNATGRYKKGKVIYCRRHNRTGISVPEYDTYTVLYYDSAAVATATFRSCSALLLVLSVLVPLCAKWSISWCVAIPPAVLAATALYVWLSSESESDIGPIRMSSVDVRASCKHTAGDRVEANYRGLGRYYSGTVQSVNNNGTYTVNYDDGDTENITAMAIKSLPRSKFSLEDTVLVTCMNKKVAIGEVLDLHPMTMCVSVKIVVAAEGSEMYKVNDKHLFHSSFLKLSEANTHEERVALLATPATPPCAPCFPSTEQGLSGRRCKRTERHRL